MPEIKNAFSKGVMNKDLDERLVPNGQYRDAMNIQVSTSEGSDVGTVQNILGNIRKEELIFGEDFKCVGAIADEKNNVFYWFVTSAVVDAIIEYSDDGTVIPILVDRKSFTPTEDVLKFDRNNLITGISIIDNLLLWTDDVNEPKKINIDTFKLNFTINNYTDMALHSHMFVDGISVGPVTEDHITVIRKRPQKAPTVVFTDSIISPINQIPQLNLFEKVVGDTVSYDFDLTNQDILDALGLVNNTGQPLPYFSYSLGEEFVISLDSEPGSLPHNYQVKLEVISSAPNFPGTWNGIPVTISGNFVFEIKELDINYPVDVALNFNATQIQEDKPIFQRELIRFATRWKYSDGEYSAYSPFTQPIFLAGKFYFHPTDDPYNKGMESKATSITIQDLIPHDTPDDVIQLDILFKKERSTTIYSIDSIKPGDTAPADHWNQKTFANNVTLSTSFIDGNSTAQYHQGFSYKSSGEYIITTENIYAALPENQMLRPWDNVPRKALAQEVTANRVIYANYLQNYNLKDYLGEPATPWIVAGQEHRKILDNPVTFVSNTGKKSIKSLRTYRLGVVYGDKYGRETPVLTSKDASIHIPFDFDDSVSFDHSADKSLRLTAKITNNQPEWAYYYKYFIKQTTGEYYNLTMDRVYKAAGDPNLWISFPSSDRNKIQEGDYFSIKKQVDAETIIPVENKIKIIDIKNEAPETIKYEYISLGSGGGSQVTLGLLFPDPSAHPGVGVKRLLIDKETWVETENGLALEDLTKSDKLAVQFSIVVSGNTVHSEKYFVSGFTVEDSGTDGRYNLILRKTIEPQDSWVESSPSVLNHGQALNITVYKLEQKAATEFEGRFFVKIISNPVTQQYLIPSAQDIFAFQYLANLPAFLIADAVGTLSASGSSTEGIYNTENTSFPTQTSGNSITNTEAEWAANSVFDGTVQTEEGGWILDYAGFVATQQNTNGTGYIGKVNARDSGRMYKGDFLNYWTTWPLPTQAGMNNYINGMEGIIAPTISPAGPVTSNSVIQFGKYRQDANGVPVGARHWSSTVINPNNDYTTTSGPNPRWSGSGDYNDSPYKPVNGGGVWMHLSYVGPGEDLHNGDSTHFYNAVYDPLNDYATENEYMKGIFYNTLQGIRASSIWIDGPYSNLDEYWNFHTVNDWEDGYNGPWDHLHDISENQWNPGWKNPGAESIKNQLVAGSRFIIVDDVDANKIYTILRVDEKRLYNHTAWNPSPKIESNGALKAYAGGTPNMSVAYRMQQFFHATQSLAYPTLNASTETANLFNAIHDFGKANNRRTCYILQLDSDPRDSEVLVNGVPTPFLEVPDFNISQMIRFVDNYIEPGSNTLPSSPAVFETEAKEDTDLNIYYEATDALPVGLDDDPTSLKGHLLGPIRSKVTCTKPGSLVDYGIQNDNNPGLDIFLRVKDWEGDIVELNSPGLKVIGTATLQAQTLQYDGKYLKFWKEDGSYATAQINSIEEITANGMYITKVRLHYKNYRHNVGLPYYNCFSFGNGVESNRVRDDFNESYILNGVKASTVLEEPYEEERRKYGIIYSGIYNNISGVNNLNQFIQAEKITKDLMPSYGSIQKLYTRDKDLITLCEDKIIQIFVDRDVLYNADGNTQLLATNRVLGEAQPFRGNYGISKNPESFAAESFRAYFTDKQRGTVLRLSMDGLTPISDIGMHDYFRDHLRFGGRLYGSYDIHKGDYNLSIYFEDGAEQVLNPEFNEGFTTSTFPVNERLVNTSFDDYSGVAGSIVTQLSRNWITGSGQQCYTTYIDLDDSTGVEVGMNIIEITGADTITFPANMQVYPITANSVNIVTINTIAYGGGIGGSDRLMLSGTLAGISGTATLGAVSGYDVTFEKIHTLVHDNWTLPGSNSIGAPGMVTIAENEALYQTLDNGFAIDTLAKYEITYGIVGYTGHPKIWNSIDNQTFSVTGMGQGIQIVTAYPAVAIGQPILFSCFNGSVSLGLISIKEQQNYGGNVLHWDLNGGSNQQNIYTNHPPFGTERIVFDEAPTDTYLHQALVNTNPVLGFDEGVDCRVKLIVHDYTGSGRLTFRLYNSDGEGFEHDVDTFTNGLKEFIGTIGDATPLPTFDPRIGKFGFYNSSSNNLSCGVDDISLVIDGDGAGSTISFNEKSKGWTSFKSFVPEFGLSCVNQYYTMNLGQVWKHHDNEIRNTFYGEFTESSITPILNRLPEIVKHFNTLNYEGSQSRIIDFNSGAVPFGIDTDNNYYNLASENGWYVYSITTDKQTGLVNEFIEKEGKWFNYIKGSPNETDLSAFNFQGLGIIQDMGPVPVFGCTIPTATNFNPLATTNDGSCGFAPGAFELQIRDMTSPITTNGAVRVVYAGTQTPALGFTYAWSNGSTGSEITGLSMGPVGLTLTDGQGNLHTPQHPTTPNNFVAANIVLGCTDPLAPNFNWEANTDDGSCII